MSKISDNSHYYVAGFGLWHILRWVFCFYPAFILGLRVAQGIDNPDPLSFFSDPLFVGGMTMAICYGVLLGLIELKQWFILACIYIFFAWPFIHQVVMYFIHLDSGPGGTNECFPLPPIDWWPLW